MFHLMGTGSRSLVTEPKHVRKEVMDTTRRHLIHLDDEVTDLVVISGMAEGWDEMLAVLAIELNIPLHAYLPNNTYGEYYWGRKSLLGRNRLPRFQELLAQAADIHISCSGIYQQGIHANFIRNTDMVNASNLAWVYDKGSSGTRDAVAKLKQAGKPYEVYPFIEQLTLL